MAQSRDLNVNVSANTQKFESGMKSAAASASVLAREQRRLERQQAQLRQAYDRAGTGLMTFGATTLAATGLAVKAAVDWESAWTGVMKTVDGNEKQMAALEGSLRALARELPASHQQIAAVAEAAGQLGVKRDAIVGFTRTMIALGETTNLTAEEAATGIAQITNIMGTSQQDVDRFGAALVELGNNGASTEAEILEMTKRLAGAGKLIGASETDVLALANAMASIGISAEAGGGSMSRVMQKIYEAVSEGGAAVKGFAEVAGMSAAEFSAAFRRDPVSAINTFIRGLNGVEASGGNVIGVLKDLGIRSSEETRTVLGLKGATDLLGESLRMGSQAWEENRALLEEAEKRYGTTAAKLQIARNNVVDLGISIGETLLPALGEASQKVTSWLQLFRELPSGAQGAIGTLGAVAGSVGLITGASLFMIPKVNEARQALNTMGGAAGRLNKGLGAVGRFLGGPFGLAVGAALLAIGSLIDAKAEAEAAEQDFLRALEADNGALRENVALTAVKALQDEGMVDVLKEAGIPLSVAVDAIMGQNDALTLVNQRLDAYREKMGGTTPAIDAVRNALTLGSSEAANQAVKIDQLQRQIGTLGGALGGAQQRYRENQQVQEELGVSTEELTPKQQSLADKFGLTAQQAQTAADEIDGIDEAISRLFDSTFGLQESQDTLNDAFARLNEQIKRQREASEAGAGAIAGHTQAARDNRDAMRTVAEAAGELILDTWEQTGSIDAVNAATNRQKQRLGELGERLGWGNDQINTYTGFIDDARGAVIRNNNTPLKPKADTGPAERALRGGLERMRQNLTELKGTTVTIGAKFTFKGQTYTTFGPPSLRYAEGGIENHQAQIARAGAMRLWAEPETGGEAYIPLARSKRGRSLEILQQVADMFGVDTFAEGGMVAPLRWKNPTISYKPTAAFARAVDTTTLDDSIRSRFASIINTAAGQSAQGLLSSASAADYGSGVQRWRAVALRALAYTGSPLSWIGSLLRRMNQESGGNPRAINNWDSNARAGIPSQGLMQTIPPTFYAYARELAGRGITDPFANIVASIRYANARYGAAPVGWNQPGGYDEGGLARGSGLLAKKVIQPERVLSPRQTESFERLVRILDTRYGATPMVSGPRASGELRIKSGQLEIVEGRSGGLVGLMRNVVAQEMSDENDFRGR